VRVPFRDLSWQIDQLRSELDAAVAECVDQTAFVQGARVAAFERAFARHCGVDHAVGCGSGTDALVLALEALGVGQGDEVLVPAMTFVATAEAVDLVGATPVFVDVEPATATLDVEAARAAVTERTAAILPVHLYGHPADCDGVRTLAVERGLRVVGDAAQAHGARCGGRPLATLADVTCYSFYPAKNLGAFGDAGAAVTGDAALAERMRMRRNHGRSDKYEHLFAGANQRMDEIQGAVLGVKLPHLDGWNEQRAQQAAHYTVAFDDLPWLDTPSADTDDPAWHLYVVRTERRDALAEHLRDRGIGAGLHYPIPLHLQPAYAHLGQGPGRCPVAERVADTCLSLPVFEGMTAAQQEAVIEAVRGFRG
jgi:dTDP-3-amino-3,4,6-trideoxy-alpha-D-glucose transaminase